MPPKLGILHFANEAKQKLNYQMQSEMSVLVLAKKIFFNISSKNMFGLNNPNPFTFIIQQVDTFVNINTSSRLSFHTVAIILLKIPAELICTDIWECFSLEY